MLSEIGGTAISEVELRRFRLALLLVLPAHRWVCAVAGLRTRGGFGKAMRDRAIAYRCILATVVRFPIVSSSLAWIALTNAL